MPPFSPYLHLGAEAHRSHPDSSLPSRAEFMLHITVVPELQADIQNNLPAFQE